MNYNQVVMNFFCIYITSQSWFYLSNGYISEYKKRTNKLINVSHRKGHNKEKQGIFIDAQNKTLKMKCDH